MDSSHTLPVRVWSAMDIVQTIPWHLWVFMAVTALVIVAATLYSIVFIAAPIPRAPLREEESYITVGPDGKTTKPAPLPSWLYTYLGRKELGQRTEPAKDKDDVEPAEVFVSLVVPAYNEEKRLGVMLEEAIDYLDRTYAHSSDEKTTITNGSVKRRRKDPQSHPVGWEILVVSDGSTDRTVDIALNFARRNPGGHIRILTLVNNRGKGGAVTHGMRHVRGEYIAFADADGASRFSDLEHLVSACQNAEDEYGRAVAVGSRAHLVGSEAVVKRSRLRNFLMHSFHLLLWVLTPPATSNIGDTQCGFKLFSRQALPYIIPHMHSEGWIFDVEMLMLAESAKIPMVEVPIGWKEVKGSKLNVVWDSLGMAWGLAILRAAWAMGVYRV